MMFRPEIILSLLIPFIGTCLGAACVFLSRRALSPGTQKALTGFASGVMVAASVWSLLIPAMDMCAPMGRFAFLPAVGIIYQPILKVTDNNINYNKKTINTNQTLLVAGFDFKFGPIVLGANYRYSFKPFFRELDGAHFQYINICAGFQF